MAWEIRCNNPQCSPTWASNIVDLLNNHRNNEGWFICEKCTREGYIPKEFKVQEGGDPWTPNLRGAIRLEDDLEEPYQPFVFIVSEEPNGLANNAWFSYYKDLRSEGGRLKLGYSPGGPPVLNSDQIITLVKKMVELGCISKTQLEELSR